MSSIMHLKCLSAVKSMAAVRQLTPAAFPGNHCPMHTALSLGSRIQGVSTLVIGTEECGYYSRNIPAASPYAGQALHWTYLLDSREIVFGFRQGLMKAIRTMDEAGAKVILLLATCVPEVIGEDIEAIIFEMQPGVDARLLYIPLGNFKCGSYQPGYWKTLLALGNLAEKKKNGTGVVNILGRSKQEEHIPPPALLCALQKQGVPLRYIAPDAHLEDFVQAGDAQLSVVLSPFMNPLADYWEKEHGVPVVSLHELYSADEIRAAYARIYHVLGLLPPEDTDNRFDELKKQEQKAVQQLKGLHYISAQTGAVQPLPLICFLASRSMHPVMMQLEEYFPSDARWRDKLLAQNENPIVCLMVNEQADMEVIEALRPDMVVGDWGGRSKKSPASVPVLDLYGHIGYERSAILLKRLLHAAKEAV